VSDVRLTTDSERPVREAAPRNSATPQRALIALELLTGVAGLIGGVLLAAAPNGSLLHADPAALEGSPFSNWRMPGVLLAALVGVGFVLAAWWQFHDYRYARELSMMAGAGLVCFEAAELAWIGFQSLQAVFAVIGGAIVILAWRMPRAQPGAKPERS
jgi:hypothetical protein